MRHRWDHEAPEGHQSTPRDNTTRYVYAQVSRWLRTDEPVHPEIAMEIAAWWHGPGRLDTAVTAFAATGDVKIHGIGGWDDYAGYGPDLADAVRRIIAKEDHEAIDRQALSALLAYVCEVERYATRYRRSIWHGGGHRLMSTGTVDEDSCLTCGVYATLRPDSEDGDYGSYFGGDGELIITCTGRTDLVHGSVQECEADNGRPCDEALTSDTGNCTHIDHVCNCLLCLN
jgi:hypothetical protein